MRNLLLALAALLVLGGAAFLFLRPVPPPASEEEAADLLTGDDAPSEFPSPGSAAPGGSVAPGSSKARAPGSNPLPGSAGRQPDGGGFRPPQAPREGEPPGEILKPDLPEEEAKQVEETRRTLLETDLGRVEWRGRTLKSVAEEIASKSGVPVVLEGEDIADEPVMMGGDAVSARAALDHIAGSRTLRFEVQPGKVVIRR